jgi:hypothetical protein
VRAGRGWRSFERDDPGDTRRVKNQAGRVSSGKPCSRSLLFGQSGKGLLVLGGPVALVRNAARGGRHAYAETRTAASFLRNLQARLPASRHGHRSRLRQVRVKSARTMFLIPPPFLPCRPAFRAAAMLHTDGAPLGCSPGSRGQLPLGLQPIVQVVSIHSAATQKNFVRADSDLSVARNQPGTRTVSRSRRTRRAFFPH